LVEQKRLDNKTQLEVMNDWKNMPEYLQEDKLAYRQIIINFEKEEDVQKFATLTGEHITDKTRSFWFPHKARGEILTKWF